MNDKTKIEPNLSTLKRLIPKDLLTRLLSSPEFLAEVLKHQNAANNVIEPILVKHLDIEGLIEEPGKDVQEIFKVLGMSWAEDFLNITGLDLIEAIKKSYHNHDLDVQAFINDLADSSKGLDKTLLLRY